MSVIKIFLTVLSLVLLLSACDSVKDDLIVVDPDIVTPPVVIPDPGTDSDSSGGDSVSDTTDGDSSNDSDTDVNTVIYTAGNFSVSEIKGLKSQHLNTMQVQEILESKTLDGMDIQGVDQVLTFLGQDTKSAGIVIDMGRIRVGGYVFNLITNQGSNAIKDIIISGNHSAITNAPAKQSELKGLNSLKSSKGSFDNTFIVATKIFHGKDTLGYGPLLTTGNFKIHIVGTTVSGNEETSTDSMAVTASIEIKAVPLFADFDLLVDGVKLNFNEPTNTGTTTLGGVGFLPYYVVGTKNIKFVNKGNVDLGLKMTRTNSDIIETDFGSIAPDEFKELSFNGFRKFQIDTGRTVSDYTKFTIGNDSNIYVLLQER